jgi:hypothetical protein
MPIDFIPLNGCKVSPKPTGKKYVFELVAGPEMGNKSFLIETTTKEDMDDWINKIKAQASSEISTPFGVSHNLHVDFGVSLFLFFRNFSSPPSTCTHRIIASLCRAYLPNGSKCSRRLASQPKTSRTMAVSSQTR